MDHALIYEHRSNNMVAPPAPLPLEAVSVFLVELRRLIPMDHGCTPSLVIDEFGNVGVSLFLKRWTTLRLEAITPDTDVREAAKRVAETVEGISRGACDCNRYSVAVGCCDNHSTSVSNYWNEKLP